MTTDVATEVAAQGPRGQGGGPRAGARADHGSKNDALIQMARALEEKAAHHPRGQSRGPRRARAAGRPARFLDRLTLTESRIEEMAQRAAPGRRAARPGGRDGGGVAASERDRDRARARAAGRDRLHLRVAPQRHRRRRRRSASSPATRSCCAAAARRSSPTPSSPSSSQGGGEGGRCPPTRSSSWTPRTARRCWPCSPWTATST